MTDQPTTAAPLTAEEALTEAIEGQNLYHGRYGTVPAGRTTALVILSGLRHRGFAIEREAAAAALPSVSRMAEALHAANIDCDYSRKFDRKSCAPGDGPHAIAAAAILAALAETPR